MSSLSVPVTGVSSFDSVIRNYPILIQKGPGSLHSDLIRQAASHGKHLNPVSCHNWQEIEEQILKFGTCTFIGSLTQESDLAILNRVKKQIELKNLQGRCHGILIYNKLMEDPVLMFKAQFKFEFIPAKSLPTRLLSSINVGLTAAFMDLCSWNAQKAQRSEKLIFDALIKNLQDSPFQVSVKTDAAPIFMAARDEDLNDPRITQVLGSPQLGLQLREPAEFLPKSATFQTICELNQGTSIYAFADFTHKSNIIAFHGFEKPAQDPITDEWVFEGNSPKVIQNLEQLPTILKNYHSLITGAAINRDQKILVVEGFAIVANLTVKLLQKSGFTQVSKAHSVREAWEIIQGSTPPDLVLCSQEFEDTDETGIDLLKRIRSSKTGKNIHFAMMVLEANAAMVLSEADLLGTDAFLIKPITGKQIQNDLIVALGSRALSG